MPVLFVCCSQWMYRNSVTCSNGNSYIYSINKQACLFFWGRWHVFSAVKSFFLTRNCRNDINIINLYFVRTLFLFRGPELVFCSHSLIFCGHELIFRVHVIAILRPQLNFFWPCHVWGSVLTYLYWPRNQHR